MAATKHRILLVDDHPDVRMGLRAIIQPTKDLVVCGEAENADVALQKADKLKPDLAIVDISLRGGVDGIELTRRLQQRVPQMRIVVLSLHEEQKFASSARLAGAHGYLSKAASSSHILNTIREVLRQSRQRPDATPPPQPPTQPGATAG